jgi:hypothetical protein
MTTVQAISSPVHSLQKDLPQWVTAFNNRHLPEQYLKNDWKLTLDYAKYEESSDDDVSWENNYDDEKKARIHACY